MEKRRRNQLPFILRFAECPKKVSFPNNCIYDRENGITVIENGGKKSPLVATKSLSVELGTKTAVERETDDFYPNILELETKTFMERESDDFDPNGIICEV